MKDQEDASLPWMWRSLSSGITAWRHGFLRFTAYDPPRGRRDSLASRSFDWRAVIRLSSSALAVAARHAGCSRRAALVASTRGVICFNVGPWSDSSREVASCFRTLGARCCPLRSVPGGQRGLALEAAVISRPIGHSAIGLLSARSASLDHPPHSAEVSRLLSCVNAAARADLHAAGLAQARTEMMYEPTSARVSLALTPRLAG